MGQNYSERIGDPRRLAQEWVPLEKEGRVLVNTKTQEQVQAHFIKILVKDLPREKAFFSSRCNNHQPYICRLLYFHLDSLPENNELRGMHLYTDRMLPLKEWTRDKFIIAIQGLKKLVTIHGPFKITDRLIGENEKGEIKVWMSENSVNNHPDCRYMSEEQTVADIAGILTIKNKDLASQFLGCHTLKEVYDKIVRPLRQNASEFSYSHRASDSGDFQAKKFEFIEKPPNLSAYRNVFG